jgi:16S rRNA (guanine966-N2)-methyltransferase
MLGPLHGRALDLYAGTGALGLESLSRGAASVTLVESARPAQLAIRKNVESLGVQSRVTLISATVESAQSALRRGPPFDLILTDPPWTDWAAATRTLTRLLRSDLLAPGGRLVLGHPRGKPLPLPAENGLVTWKSRHWGDSAATFYLRAEDAEPLDEPGEEAPEEDEAEASADVLEEGLAPAGLPVPD